MSSSRDLLDQVRRREHGAAGRLSGRWGPALPLEVASVVRVTSLRGALGFPLSAGRQRSCQLDMEE